MPLEGYRSITVKEETYSKLVSFAGKLQSQKGKQTSIDEAITELLKEA